MLMLKRRGDRSHAHAGGLEAGLVRVCVCVWVSARVTVARRRRFVIFMALKRFVAVDEY